ALTTGRGGPESCHGFGFAGRSAMHRAGRLILRWPSGARDGCAPRFLPSARKGRGRDISQSTVRPHLVVILTPPRELVAYIAEGEEHFHVQTLVAQSTIERFDIA